MKKILLILLFTIFFIPNVDADTAVISLTEYNKDIYENPYSIIFFYDDTQESCTSYDECYSKALNAFEESDDSYYYIRLDFSYSSSGWHAFMYLRTFNFSSSDTYTTTIQLSPSRYYFTIGDVNYLVNQSTSGTGGKKQSFYTLYDTNFPFRASQDVAFSNFYSDGSAVLTYKNELLPKFKDLVKYDSYADYKENYDNYTEVNLDNYEYVILSLRDYTKKDAFDVNLQVKGMIGVTPVYEYGTTEKDSVTDRCNVSYSDYTDYRFYILKTDLLNNAVYYVKACEEGSSFKFDNTIFNATYITTETVNDPVITVGGVQYHVIPFDKLSNTANKNEEENFVPGESGSSLTDIIDNTTNYISSFWNSLSTFMSLVTKFFNTLPIEIRAICITTFATACTLGLLKILKS